mmetsp:Transcript_27642/g.51036  ORF Transcript_27642/g.51036 Transcript_27642/m.51036 type:complete len:345 (-) Transcript_27642:731-1765(-)
MKATLSKWDISETDRILKKLTERREKVVSDRAAKRAKAIRGAEGECEAAKAENDRLQLQLRNIKQELEKRIFEHDMCVEEKKSEALIATTLEQIHIAEANLDQVRSAAKVASERFDLAKLALREQRIQKALSEGRDELDVEDGEGEEDGGEGGGAEATKNTSALSSATAVELKELNDVLVRDVGERIKTSGKWPLVVDCTAEGLAVTFLKYLDVNHVNILSPAHLAPPRLRRSLLGAVRFGKPLVLDLDEFDLWDELTRAFNQLQDGLFARLLNRNEFQKSYEKILTPIVKPEEDGEEYEPSRWAAARVANFMMVVVVKKAAARKVATAAAAHMHVMKVIMGGR